MNQLYPLPLLAQRIISHNEVAKPQQTRKPILCFMAIHRAFSVEWLCTVAIALVAYQIQPCTRELPYMVATLGSKQEICLQN